MAAPTITNGEEHFFPITYAGNGQGQRVGKFVPFTNNGTIAKSVMYNDGDSAYIQRTPSSETNRDTWTLSYWVKRGVIGATKVIFQQGADQNNCVNHMFDSNNRLNYQMTNSGSYTDSLITNMTFEDTSKWYHIVLAVDTTQSTEAYRVRMYVDGDEITSWNTANYPAQNVDTDMNTTTAFRIGGQVSGSLIGFDGYLAEVNFIDGQQLTPSTFGLTDTSTGRWIPKTLSGITYGTNGFRLQFGTDSALGDDTSGNTNDFSSSGLTTSDQRNDTPTNNLPTMRPYNPSYNTTQAQGNLQYTATGTNAGYPMCSTLRPNSGKWYAEVRTSTNGGGNVITMGIYIQEDMHSWDNSANFYPGGQLSNGDGCGAGLWVSTGTNYLVSSTLDAQIVTSNPTYSLAAGDVFGIAVDVDNSLVSFYGNNGSLIGSTSILRPGRIMFTAMAVTSSDTWNWNFGDNPTFDGNETAGGNADEDGNGNFYHSVPAGFKMLRQQSMTETGKGVSGLVWIKNRDDNSYNHGMWDSSRGAFKFLSSNTDGAEGTALNGTTKFLKGGYTVGAGGGGNNADNSICAWCWVANGGTTATNNDGSITSTVQANQAAGFSIVQFTGTSSNGSVGHGLSQAPEWIMIKIADTASVAGFTVSTTADPNGFNNFLYLNETEISRAYNNWQDTAPTSSVFTVTTGGTANQTTKAMLAYCWHSVDGVSKFGRYTGNGSLSSGPFVYTGFKPAFLMYKGLTEASQWDMLDNKRNPFNPQTNVLSANLTNADRTPGSYTSVDFLSNGFQIRASNDGINKSGNQFVYMAFAEHPFVGDGTNPVTAR